MLELLREQRYPLMLLYQWDPHGCLLVDWADSGIVIIPKMMELFLWEMQAFPTVQ